MLYGKMLNRPGDEHVFYMPKLFFERSLRHSRAKSWRRCITCFEQLYVPPARYSAAYVCIFHLGQSSVCRDAQDSPSYRFGSLLGHEPERGMESLTQLFGRLITGN